jgi:hypothetical protein
MNFRRLLPPVLLLTLAFAIGRAVATRDGVGVVEYAIGIALIVVLLLGAIRMSRHAIR